jgi:hypothetical protein
MIPDPHRPRTTRYDRPACPTHLAPARAWRHRPPARAQHYLPPGPATVLTSRPTGTK